MKLNLGCGVWLKKGFVNVDILKEEDIRSKKGQFKNAKIEKGAKYVEADIRKLPFKDNSANYVEIFSTLEHLPFRDVIPALKEIYRVMKRGAKLIITTDDFDGMAHDWLKMRVGPFDLKKYMSVMETIYGNQLHDGEHHKVGMTPDFLNACLATAGFKKGKLSILPKGSPIPKIGSKPASPKMVFRNDQILAEIEK